MPSFPFLRLPPELRDIIWEATLPPARLFHVSGTHDGSLSFHVRPPPPTITAVCRESRAAALRLGGFVFASPASTCPHRDIGPWFRPRLDILYFDRNQRRQLTALIRPFAPLDASSTTGASTTNASTTDASTLTHIIHIGLEWRAWFRDVPHRNPGPDMRRDWRLVLLSLARMPRLAAVHFILPRVRQPGGVVSGREPYGAAEMPAALEMLSPNEAIPWYSARVGTRGSRPMTAWADIRGDMLRSIGEEGAEGAEGACGKSLEVMGWLLLREGMTIKEEEQEEQQEDE